MFEKLLCDVRILMPASIVVIDIYMLTCSLFVKHSLILLHKLGLSIAFDLIGTRNPNLY